MKTILFKPFERYSAGPLLIVGFFAAALAIVASQGFNTRFDGALDFHTAQDATWLQALLDSLINVGTLFLFLYLAAVISYKKTRPVDILATVLVARIPMALLPLLNVNNYSHKVAEGLIAATQNLEDGPEQLLSHLPFLIFMVLVLLAVTVWTIILLYNGYKVASNAKGTQPVLLFVAGLLLAETLSKIILYFLK